MANVTPEHCTAALACFLAPDLESSTQDHEGRRVEEIPGGWFILNYAKYRDLIDAEARKAQWRESSKKHRQKKSATVSEPSPKSARRQRKSAPTDTAVDADTATERSKASVALRAPLTLTPDISLVLVHYTAAHPKRKPGVKEGRIVERALALGYSVADLCEAIDGNAADPWHREKGKHDLGYVLRDAGHIDDARAARTAQARGQTNGTRQHTPATYAYDTSGNDAALKRLDRELGLADEP